MCNAYQPPSTPAKQGAVNIQPAWPQQPSKLQKSIFWRKSKLSFCGEISKLLFFFDIFGTFVIFIIWDFGIIHIFHCLRSHAGVILLFVQLSSQHRYTKQRQIYPPTPSGQSASRRLTWKRYNPHGARPREDQASMTATDRTMRVQCVSAAVHTSKAVNIQTAWPQQPSKLQKSTFWRIPKIEIIILWGNLKTLVFF